MQGTEEKKVKDQRTGGEAKWVCHKRGGRPVENQENPKCPDPSLYCKFRTSCMIYNRSLLEED